MQKTLRLLTAATALIFIQSLSTPAEAFFSPASVSIIPPVQFPPSNFSITGARVSALWGRHRDVYGIDLSLLGNVTDQDFVGSAIAGVTNITRGTTNVIGVQLAGITNVNMDKTNIYGLQLAAGLNYNKATGSLVGLQAALLGNVSEFTDIYGAQVGLYNRAQSVRGFQIGLVNVTNNLRGIQIGLVNFNHGGIFAVSPIINVGF